MNAPPGEAFVLPVWVDRDEVSFTVADASLKSYRTAERTIVRIKLSSLAKAASGT